MHVPCRTTTPLTGTRKPPKSLGYDGLLAPLTFVSLVGIIAQRKLFEEIVTGYDLEPDLQTDQGSSSTSRSRSATA